MKLVGEAERVHKKPLNTKLRNQDLNLKTRGPLKGQKKEFQLDSTLQIFLQSAARMTFTKLRSPLVNKPGQPFIAFSQ